MSENGSKKRLPTVLIFSSLEAVDVAEALKQPLADAGLSTIIWSDIKLGTNPYYLLSVLDALKQVDGAVVLTTPDDRTFSRMETSEAPRDNILFELGLSLATLTPRRTFVLRPITDVKLPTDLEGLTQLRFDPGNADSLTDAAAEIGRVVCENTRPNQMKWSEFRESLKMLHNQIMRDEAQGGFRPHALVGVNVGGAIAGGLMFYWCQGYPWFCCLGGRQPDPHISALELHELGQYLSNHVPHQVRPRILLIDDALGTGKTMSQASTLITQYLSLNEIDPEIRTAVVIDRQHRYSMEQLASPQVRPDYVAHWDYDELPYTAL